MIEVKTYPLFGTAYKSIATVDPKTHAVDGTGQALCRRVNPKSIMVDDSFETDSEPTCKTCRLRDPRFVDLRIGKHVELSPACDLWMRGSKFGTVVAVKNGLLVVRMDNPKVRKLQRLSPDLVRLDAPKSEYGLGYMQGRGAA